MAEQLVPYKVPKQFLVETVLGLAIGLAAAATLRFAVGGLGLFPLVLAPLGFLVVGPIGNLWVMRRGAEMVTRIERGRRYNQAIAERPIATILACSALLFLFLTGIQIVGAGSRPLELSTPWVAANAAVGAAVGLLTWLQARFLPTGPAAVETPEPESFARWLARVLPRLYLCLAVGLGVNALVGSLVPRSWLIGVGVVSLLLGFLGFRVAMRRLRAPRGRPNLFDHIGRAIIVSILSWALPTAVFLLLNLYLYFPRPVGGARSFELYVTIILLSGAIFLFGGVVMGAFIWLGMRVIDWMPGRRGQG